MLKTRIKKAAPSPVSSATIFARLWETDDGKLTPALARHILKLSFSAADQARMHELAEKNQEGRISTAERGELDNYVTVADLLGILKSKARQRLKPA